VVSSRIVLELVQNNTSFHHSFLAEEKKSPAEAGLVLGLCDDGSARNYGITLGVAGRKGRPQ
jgi:hypothetical protein